jgi:hypothetical protein
MGMGLLREPWLIVSTQDQASTDPAALAVPSANSWVIAYVTDSGLPKLRRYNPPTGGGRSTESFADRPFTE